MQFENLTENFSEKLNKTNKKKMVHEINPNYFILLTTTVFYLGVCGLKTFENSCS